MQTLCTTPFDQSTIDVGNLLLFPLKMNRSDIATQGLAPLKIADNMFQRYGPEFLNLPSKTSWPRLHVGDSFNSQNIGGISNNGMLCISSNIDNRVHKTVHAQFSIYNESRLREASYQIKSKIK